MRDYSETRRKDGRAIMIESLNLLSSLECCALTATSRTPLCISTVATGHCYCLNLYICRSFTLQPLFNKAGLLVRTALRILQATIDRSQSSSNHISHAYVAVFTMFYFNHNTWFIVIFCYILLDFAVLESLTEIFMYECYLILKAVELLFKALLNRRHECFNSLNMTVVLYINGLMVNFPLLSVSCQHFYLFVIEI